MRRQKGFTLIELAIVLVIIGVIMGAILKGQALIENARAKHVVSQVRELESMTWGFLDRYGRFPGDCPVNQKDGLIDTRANRSWDINDLSADNTPPSAFCQGGELNRPLNDLKYGGFYDSDISNRELFGTEYQGIVGLGYVRLGTKNKNVIFVNDIPCWLAQEIDVTLDRRDSPGAGKVRHYTSYSNVESDRSKNWDNICTGGVEDIVDIVYIFERH